MTLSVYRNERTNHTYQTERHGEDYVIVEYDCMGKQPQIMGVYPTKDKAQEEQHENR